MLTGLVEIAHGSCPARWSNRAYRKPTMSVDTKLLQRVSCSRVCPIRAERPFRVFPLGAQAIVTNR